MTRNGLTIEYEKEPDPPVHTRPLWLEILLFGLFVGVVVVVFYR